MTRIADLPDNVKSFIPCKSVTVRNDKGNYI